MHIILTMLVAEELGSRIRAERQRLGGTQDDWAAIAGIHRNSQRAYEQGKTSPPTDYLLRIAEAGADINYILTGRKGLTEELRDWTRRSAVTDQAEEIAEELGLMRLPEIDIAVGMGAGYVDEPVIEGTDRWMPAEWVRSFTDAPAARLAIIRPRGDSMYPTINDRDIVLIDRGDQRIEEQDLIWTLVYGGLRTIRRVRAMPDGTYKLMGDNQAVREETAHDNEMFVIGRVVGVVRRL